MSCVNQVYESDNANFQASVSLPSNVLNGGNFVGGYDAILNKVIFAYENPCIDPSAVEIVTSNWSSSYVSNKNKTALDEICAGTSTSTPVLAYNGFPSTKDTSDVKIYAAILAVLLGLRIYWHLQQRKKKPGRQAPSRLSHE